MYRVLVLSLALWCVAHPVAAQVDRAPARVDSTGAQADSASAMGDRNTRPDRARPEPHLAASLVGLVLVTEFLAFGSGAAARWEPGALAIGTIQGLSGLLILSMSAREENNWPAAEIPYGIGFLVLATYNFTAAASGHGADTRFWNNVLGTNAIMVGTAVSALLFTERSGVSIHAGPSGIYASVRF